MSDTESENEKIVKEVRHSSSETSYDDEDIEEPPKPEAKSDSQGTLVSREYNLSIVLSFYRSYRTSITKWSIIGAIGTVNKTRNIN